MYRSSFRLSAIALIALLACVDAPNAAGQCDSCVPATATFQPAVQTAYYQPTVALQPYTGWYPGKLLDRLRLNRWFGDATAGQAGAPAYTAAYDATLASPSGGYTAAYAPTTSYYPYTTSYSPYSSPYSASYTPYLTSYAPLQRTSTVYRPVVLRPVVAMQPVVAAGGCDLCSTGCSACSTCESAGVGQATYYDQPSTSCPSCQEGAMSNSPLPLTGQSGTFAPGGFDASGGNGGHGGVIVGPPTPQPRMDQQSQKPPGSLGATGATPDPAPVEDTSDPSSSFRFFDNKQLEAPGLIPLNTDRSASQPTVPVWNAVYRNQTNASLPVSRSVSRPQPEPRATTEAERIAAGWVAVPRERDRQANRAGR